MKNFTFSPLLILLTLFSALVSLSNAQTVIPNGDFESWDVHSNYSDPTSWDTPDSALMSIPFFGQAVVFKSTDHHGGSFSAKLVSKHIAIPGAPVDVPGFMTLGKLTVDILGQTFSITGGVPIHDQPTHLMGYYKFSPVGGDSCVAGIVLYKTINGVSDTIAGGYFTAKDAAADWTHFSAWIQYDTLLTPDTMNILVLSSAQTDLHANTTLYIDDLYLDYTVGYNEQNPAAGISVYQDKETLRLIVFCEFPKEQTVVSRLYDMNGRQIAANGPSVIGNGRMVIPYGELRQGIYILAVQHDGKTFTKKFLLGF